MKVTREKLNFYHFPKEKVEATIEVNDVLEKSGLTVNIIPLDLLLEDWETIKLSAEGFSSGTEALIAAGKNEMYKHVQSHMELLDNAIHDEMRARGAKNIVNQSCLGHDWEDNYSVYLFSYKNVGFKVTYLAPDIKIYPYFKRSII
jgi:hypothetical protein